jgi:hypothetical protein
MSESPIYRFNVSAIKAFRLCPQRWLYTHVMRRVPAVTPAVLTGGRLWHKFRERQAMGEPVALILDSLKPEVQIALDELWARMAERTARDVEAVWKLIQDAAPHWSERFAGRTLCVEEPMELVVRDLLPDWGDRPDIRIIGIPDRAKVLDVGHGLVSVQVRTLGGSTPLAPYLKAKEIDLHELLYGLMVQKRFGDEGEYLGTEFDILRKMPLFSDRKCKSADTKWHQDRLRSDCPECHYEGRVRTQLHDPTELFVQEIVPINMADAWRGLQEAASTCLAMLAWQNNTSPYPPPRAGDSSICLGEHGNVICPYFDVDTGQAELEDDNLFKDADDRYALAAPAEEVE